MNNNGGYQFVNPIQEKHLSKKKVIVYTGPEASDRKKQVSLYASTSGVKYINADWSLVKPLIQFMPSKVVEVVLDRHLNISKYPINDQEANNWVAGLVDQGIRFLISTDEDPTISLPQSFLVIKCQKEVSHV
jgi:hypothetical protein